MRFSVLMTLSACFLVLSSACDTTRCAQKGNVDECNNAAGCLWDQSNKCLSKAAASCREASGPGACFNLSGCVWDPARRCLSRTRSTCSESTADISCGQIVGCQWNLASQTCILPPGNAFLCSSHKAQTECVVDNCIWDGGTSTCIGKTSSCITAKSQDACSRIVGCIWDQASKCLSQRTSPCSDATYYDTCIGVPGCVWKDSRCTTAQ